MRRLLGWIALGLSGFLLVAAVLGTFWAPGIVKKTPIDVNSTTRLSGEAARLDTATGDFTKRPIWAVSITKVDSGASTDDTAVFVSESCAQFDVGQEKRCSEDVEDPNQITVDVDTFASDRTTALSLSKNLPKGTTAHEGVVNKWPFDTKKKTYPYWDGTVSRAVDAKYVREEKVAGVNTYVFEVRLQDEPIQIGDGIDGTYNDVKTLYIEPRTGSILKQTDDQQRYLTDGAQVLDLQVAFTDEQVKTLADEAKDNIASLNAVTKIVPIVGFVLGAILLAVGLLLTRRNRPEADQVSLRKEPVAARH